jgi:Rps23 Pro-64 3,4-dihydroxylase Tpa1-like proline 4-hydroxylase
MEKVSISSRLTDDIQKTKVNSISFMPWHHIVIDDFIEQDQFISAQKDLMSRNVDFKIKQGDKNKIQYALLDYMPLAKLMYSIDFLRFINSISDQKLTLNESSLVQIRKADNTTPPFPRHVDDSDLGRSLIVIVYISPGWKPENGGRLALHKGINSKRSSSVYIEPKQNRLVAFFSDSNNWHSVEKVHNWERLSIISEWLCT